METRSGITATCSKISVCVLLAFFSAAFGETSAKAGGLGSYQRKILSGGSAGGSVGGKVLGTPGAIVGAAIGAANADQQHHKNKVHNYRTPMARWQRFNYGSGAFVRQGHVWVEYQNGRPMYSFVEVRRLPNSIDLFDGSRQITVRIEQGRTLILVPGRNWQYLYAGTNH